MIERLAVVLPETFAFGAALVYLVLATLAPGRAFKPLNGIVSLLAIAAAWKGLAIDEQTRFFGTYRIDAFSQGFKAVLLVLFALILNMPARKTSKVADIQTEIRFLLGVALLGMMLMTGVNDLLVLYLAVETASYSFYMLTVLRGRILQSTEAGLKYLFFGATATALMLFGMSWLYGVAGTTSISAIAKHGGGPVEPAFVLGGVLFLAGLLYKLSAAPFHFWAPDVYEGAPNRVAAYLATASKAAAVALTVRILHQFAGGQADAANTLKTVLWISAFVSIVYGNFVAIRQRDMKRMLAYSGVAHAGYLLTGVLAALNLGTADAYNTVVFYAITYVFTNLAAFVVVHSSLDDDADAQIRNFNDLHKHRPLLAATLLLSMFSLGGLPPLVGFFGKFYLFMAAWQAQLYTLVVTSILASTVSLYYYLRVVQAAYLDPARGGREAVPAVCRARDVICFALMAFMIAAGVVPQPFIDACAAITNGLF